MDLKTTLEALNRHHMEAIPAQDRRDFEDELDRLRMMRVAEDGLGLGDVLPDFGLQDGTGRVWTSGELLDLGPLVLALFRGDWCPYCGLTMEALERARPAVEALGAGVVGIIAELPGQAAEAAARHQLRYPLLSDPANGFGRRCGLVYELSPKHARLHRVCNRGLPVRQGDSVWRLALSAAFVVDRSGQIVFAFTDVDPARWPDPEEMLASLRALGDASALSNR